MKNETLIESFNTDNNDVQENITKIKKPNNKNNSSKCIYRLFHNLLFSLSITFIILSIITYQNTKEHYEQYTITAKSLDEQNKTIASLEKDIANLSLNIEDQKKVYIEIRTKSEKASSILSESQRKYENISREVFVKTKFNEQFSRDLKVTKEKGQELIDNITMIKSLIPNTEIFMQFKKEYTENLQHFYQNLVNLASKQSETINKIKLNEKTLVSTALNSDIFNSYDEYKTLQNWILSDNEIAKQYKGIFTQKFKLMNDSDAEIENLFKKEKEILSSRKPIIILVSLSAEERFGYAILSPQLSLFNLDVQNDNKSFLFSLSKNQKYLLVNCNQQRMKTSYILSFRRDMEIMLPNACFENDNFFAVNPRFKFYKTKKHFGVTKVEIYILS